MKKCLRYLISLFVFALVSSNASAQFAVQTSNNLEFYRATVGTTTAVAIPAASIKSSVLSWALCNDSDNTSLYLLLGEAADVATDGKKLAKGECHVCENCSGATLSHINVKGQAAANAYSIVMMRK